jgi:uncharacterized protein YdaU (DUF1376 family)
MNEKNNAWVRFFPNDWMGGVFMLPLEARGAYITLLAIQAAGQKIPDDLEQLQIACPGMSISTWNLIRSKFDVVEDPDTGERYLQNGKMTEEVERATQKRETETERQRAYRERKSANNEERTHNVTRDKTGTSRAAYGAQNKNKNKKPSPPKSPPMGESLEGGGDGLSVRSLVREYCEKFNRKRESSGSSLRLSGDRLVTSTGRMSLEDWETVVGAFTDAYVEGVNNPKRAIKHPTAFMLNLMRESRESASAE